MFVQERVGLLSPRSNQSRFRVAFPPPVLHPPACDDTRPSGEPQPPTLRPPPRSLGQGVGASMSALFERLRTSRSRAYAWGLGSRAPVLSHTSPYVSRCMCNSRLALSSPAPSVQGGGDRGTCVCGWRRARPTRARSHSRSHACGALGETGEERGTSPVDFSDLCTCPNFIPYNVSTKDGSSMGASETGGPSQSGRTRRTRTAKPLKRPHAPPPVAFHLFTDRGPGETGERGGTHLIQKNRVDILVPGFGPKRHWRIYASRGSRVLGSPHTRDPQNAAPREKDW